LRVRRGFGFSASATGSPASPSACASGAFDRVDRVRLGFSAGPSSAGGASTSASATSVGASAGASSATGASVGAAAAFRDRDGFFSTGSEGSSTTATAAGSSEGSSETSATAGVSGACSATSSATAASAAATSAGAAAAASALGLRARRGCSAACCGRTAVAPGIGATRIVMWHVRLRMRPTRPRARACHRLRVGPDPT
jgi:hypothetical protein